MSSVTPDEDTMIRLEWIDKADGKRHFSDPITRDSPVPICSILNRRVATVIRSLYDPSTIWLRVADDNTTSNAVAVRYSGFGIRAEETRVRIGDYHYDLWLDEECVHFQLIWTPEMLIAGMLRTVTEHPDVLDCIILSSVEDGESTHIRHKWSMPMFETRNDLVIGSHPNCSVQIPQPLTLSKDGLVELVSDHHFRICERTSCVGDLNAVVRDGTFFGPSQTGTFIIPDAPFGLQIGSVLSVDGVDITLVQSE